MGSFTTKLDVTLKSDSANDGRGTWVLTSPLVYINGTVSYTVPAGYETDFATVPRIPFVFDAFGDSAHEATALHDWLYSTKPVTRAVADKTLYQAMIDTNVPRWRATAMYIAVRLFGKSHW